MPRQVKENDKINSIIDFLCADSGSHDYMIDRREATELGLKIHKPTENLYRIMRDIHLSYVEELKLLEPYSVHAMLSGSGTSNQPVPYSITRALIEGTVGGCFGYVSDGTLQRIQTTVNNIPQVGIHDERIFEGWRKI